MTLSAVLVTAGFYLVATAACGSGGTAQTPVPPIADAPADAAPAPLGPKPEFLTEVEALVRGLCECSEASCVEQGYVGFHQRIEGQSLAGWQRAHVRELHVMRARAEDCNLSILTGGDTHLLEIAREAYLDSFAARAPALLTRLYDAVVARHADQQPMPVSASPTPPAGDCCMWADGLCPADRRLWAGRPWIVLGFEVDEAQAFSYQLDVDGTVVTAGARGDLDCDGDFSTFELRGDVASEPHPQIRITERLE